LKSNRAELRIKVAPLFAGQKLLVAEDSPYYRTVIGLTFSDEGMEVMMVRNSEEVLERLEEFSPDVVLAGVSMPGINGYELCERIKQSERFGHIPVMLLVGLHEVFDQAEARRVGADDFVTKPFQSIRGLVGRVGSLLGGKPADTGDARYEHSTLGLDRSGDSPAPVAEEPTMTETDVKVFIEAPAMTEHEPLEPTAEAAGTTCAADIELQTADTQALESPDEVQTAAPDDQARDDTDVRVFIEASSMTEHELHEPSVESAGGACEADIELQTADTQTLERIDDEPAETAAPISYAQNDTKEMKPPFQTEEKLDSPVDVGTDEPVSSIGAAEINETHTPQTAPSQTQPALNDELLDLDDFDAPAQVAVTEDLILDLDYDYPASESAVTAPEMVSEPVAAFAAAPPAEPIASELPQVAPTHEEQHSAELHEWAIVTEAPPPVTPVNIAREQEPSDPRMALSAADIDAIARRVVEQLSEKVVSEIAWEVVPELAELLIKKKLEEQK
jgi:CheY-like chemotaxis protein